MTEIKKDIWHTCSICNAKISDLAKKYGGCGTYYTTVFDKHLKNDHNTTLEEYFSLHTIRPKCDCNICNQEVDIGGIRKSAFYWRQYKCGRNPGILKWSEEAKTSRKGTGNPMFKKDPWNKGETKHTHKSVMKVSIKQIGRTISKETKKRQSISAKKRKIHGHTGRKHSKETRDKLRIITLNRMANGDFKHTRTKPHLKVREILDDFKIKYVEEYRRSYWSFDFYLSDLDIYLEVDGDYFHSNPRRWKNGPVSETQKKNYKRDIKKNAFCKNNGLRLIRIWEYDIMNNELEIRKQICNLKK